MDERQKVIEEIVEIATKRLAHPSTQMVDLLVFWYWDLLRELGAEKEAEEVYRLYRLGLR